MTARSMSVLVRDGFALAHQRVGSVLLDLVWKIIWLVAAGALLGVAVFWLFSKMPGPNLATSDAMLLSMALRGIYTAYSRLALWTFAIIAATAMVLRIVLEALFRGGVRQFWVFAGSRLARGGILLALGLVLGVFMAWDRSWGMVFIAAVILAGAWFLLTIAETLIRKDAVELFAADPMGAAAAIGVFLVFEAVAAALLTGFSVAAVLLSSRLVELIAAIIFAMTSAAVWSILQSYLFVVRCSTVDIMRRNVAGI